MFGWFKKDGYTDEVKSLLLIKAEQGVTDIPNFEAYEWLDRAMFASGKVKKKDRVARRTERERLYPKSAYQTEKMRQMLVKAQESVVEVDDPLYIERYEELNNIVVWSLKRHLNWHWEIIVTTILSAVSIYCIMNYSNYEDIRLFKHSHAVIDQWEDPSAPQEMTLDEKIEAADKKIERRALIHYGDVEKFRKDAATRLTYHIEASAEAAESFNRQAEEVSFPITKRMLERWAAKEEADLAKYTAASEALPSMTLDELKVFAHSWLDDGVENCSSTMKREGGIIGVFYLILITLYLIAQLPNGYTITRLRFETKVVKWFADTFLKVGAGFLIALFFFWYTAEAKEKNGRVSSSASQEAAEGGLMVNLVSRIAFLFIGIGLLIVSPVVLLYQILQGLRRNYTLNGVIARRINYTAKFEK